MTWNLLYEVLLLLTVALPTFCTGPAHCTVRQGDGLYDEYLADTENYLCFAQKTISKFDANDFIRDAEKISGYRLLRLLTKYHPLPSLRNGTRESFPSCKYSLTHRGYQNGSHVFIIEQTLCRYSTLPAGGALIEAFGRSNDSLLRCITFETNFLSGKYQVNCPFSASTKCIYLTALLTSEHFDYQNSNAIKEHRFLLLANDEEHCSTTAVLEEHAHPTMFTRLPPLPDGVSFYSGNWVSPTLRAANAAAASTNTNTNTNTRESVGAPGSNVVQRLEVFPLLDPAKVSSTHRNTSEGFHSIRPSLGAAYGPVDLTERFVFQPYVAVGPGEASSSVVKMRPTDQLPIRPVPLANASQSVGHNFVFAGSSHERNLFDALSERLLGSKIFTDVPVKRANHTFDDAVNLHYAFVAYSEHMGYFLQNFCSDLVRGHTKPPSPSSSADGGSGPTEWTKGLKNNIKSFTMVIGTGSWDLDSTYVVYSLKAPRSTPFLVSVIRGIREGRIACPGLKRMVVVLPYPYPLHHRPFNDTFPLSHRWKHGFRNTATIGALNAMLLRELTAAIPGSNSSGIALALVDSFGIISPRLVLDETVESLCTGHFLCRAHDSTVTHTRGGTAVLQAVLHALAPSAEMPL